MGGDRRRHASGRSEAVRLFLSYEAWRYFEALRDRVRRQDPGLGISTGDDGTRAVLRAWLEERVWKELG